MEPAITIGSREYFPGEEASLLAMRSLALLSLLLTTLPGLAGETTAAKQLDFGIEVAQKGLWQEARFRFEKAVELNPDHAAALNNLAVALEQMGEFDLAREAYEKALALKPGDMYIQQNYDLFHEADEKRRRKARKPD